MTRRTGLCAGGFPAVLLLAGLNPGPAVADSRPADWPAVTPGDVSHDSATTQVTRTMRLDLPADADAVFPLFGPARESEWSPDWKPVFVTPQPPAQSRDGAVFITGDHESATVWVMTDYDPGRRIVRYVHMRPRRLVAQLWIRVSPASPHSSQAEVTYRYTVLGPEGRDALDHFRSAFPMFKPHWEQALRAALSRQTGGAKGH